MCIPNEDNKGRQTKVLYILKHESDDSKTDDSDAHYTKPTQVVYE